MTSEERALITGLFDRLRAADVKNPSRDPEAEELIGRLTAQLPGTSYLLAQTTLVQEHALANAQTRIQTLERQLAQAQQQAQQQQRPPAQAQGGGFLAGLFGGHSTPPPAPVQQPPPPLPQQQQYAQSAPPPYPSTVGMAPAAGGGFLRGALSTAAGVAGGALLFQGIENLLGHNAGPFGPSLGGGGGFFGGGGRGSEIIENTEVVNNYYGDETAQHQHGGHGGDAGGIPAGIGEHPAQPGYEDARFDDSNFDSSNPFSGPGGGLMPDNSSLDNNYDASNPDAGDSGGSFLAGDVSGNDDGGGFFGSDNSDSGSFLGGDDSSSDDNSGMA